MIHIVVDSVLIEKRFVRTENNPKRLNSERYPETPNANLGHTTLRQFERATTFPPSIYHNALGIDISQHLSTFSRCLQRRRLSVLPLRTSLLVPKPEKVGLGTPKISSPISNEQPTGELVFGVARIFASFNDTFVHVTDLRFVPPDTTPNVE